MANLANPGGRARGGFQGFQEAELGKQGFKVLHGFLILVFM